MKILPIDYWTNYELETNISELNRLENFTIKDIHNSPIETTDLIELNEQLGEIIFVIWQIEQLGGITLARLAEIKLGSVENFSLVREIKI